MTIIRSPLQGVFYTIETFYGYGPSSDDTQVFAHLERNGKLKKQLVLDGENLELRIIWNDPHDATLCLAGSITHTYDNVVTLIVGDAPEDSETIHNHLDEHCDSR